MPCSRTLIFNISFSRHLRTRDLVTSPEFTSGSIAGLMPRPFRMAKLLPGLTAAIRTAPRTTDELERLGVPMTRTTASLVSEAERKVQLKTAELENRQKLWRWFILATLMVLLVETWLAGWTARRVSVVNSEAT